MNDYLSNLVMRSTGVGEGNASNLLHPRLPSLFETPNIEGQFPGAISSDTISHSVEPFQTIFAPSEKGSSVRSPQKDEANPTQSLKVNLQPIRREEQSPVAEKQKQLEFLPSDSKLNPLPVGTGLPSILAQIHHAEKRESIIQVHIGRVEVRAVTSSQPTSIKKSSSTAPKLSLDDYLKQRNEGKR